MKGPYIMPGGDLIQLHDNEYILDITYDVEEIDSDNGCLFRPRISKMEHVINIETTLSRSFYFKYDDEESAKKCRTELIELFFPHLKK